MAVNMYYDKDADLGLLKRSLPALLNSNSYYFLATKALLMGLLYLASKLVIS